MTDSLTKKQLNTWREFRFMVEETSLSVSRALYSATGVSGGQFGILSILLETPGYCLRQQSLANAMRWDRTRLSHQLTRMEKQGWVVRQKAGAVTVIALSNRGREKHELAAPILGEVVKERFFGRLTQSQLNSLRNIREALAS